jgi:hypothetical protein
MAAIRIATFNLENFDETAPNQRPSLAERIALMKPQILRLRADIASLGPCSPWPTCWPEPTCKAPM